MTPREMFIHGLLAFRYPGNVHKRVNRLDRLADAIGAKVYYGLNNQSIGIQCLDGVCYEASGLRDAEHLLRQLRRQEA